MPYLGRKNSRRAVAIGYKNWRTPRSFFDTLDAEFHFTLDAAASHANALVDKYCTEEGKFVRALSYPQESSPPVFWRLSAADGLEPSAWIDEVVFCNPPYDQRIRDWVELANARRAEVSVLLLPPSIDTEWFSMVWTAGRAKTYSTPEYHSVLIWPDREIRFMRKRIRFLRPKHFAITGAGAYDESDLESVLGESPRAGNLVVITYRQARKYQLGAGV